MTILGISILGLIVSGLAVKQAAFILLYGSIFDWLRKGINKKMKTAESKGSKWFWEKANELFTCILCMATQVAIWMCAVPFIILLHIRYPHPFELVLQNQLPFSLEIFFACLLAFIVSMAIAGVSMAIWNFSEYPSKKLGLIKKYHQIMLESNLTHPNSYANNDKDIIQKFSLLNLLKLFDLMEEKCPGLGCGPDRVECREDTILEYIKEWAALNQLPYPQLKLTNRLGEIFKYYYTNANTISDPKEYFEKAHSEMIIDWDIENENDFRDIENDPLEQLSRQMGKMMNHLKGAVGGDPELMDHLKDFGLEGSTEQKDDDRSLSEMFTIKEYIEILKHIHQNCKDTPTNDCKNKALENALNQIAQKIRMPGLFKNLLFKKMKTHIASLSKEKQFERLQQAWQESPIEPTGIDFPEKFTFEEYIGLIAFTVEICKESQDIECFRMAIHEKIGD